MFKGGSKHKVHHALRGEIYLLYKAYLVVIDILSIAML